MRLLEPAASVLCFPRIKLPMYMWSAWYMVSFWVGEECVLRDPMCTMQKARVNHVGPHLPRHHCGRPRHPPLHRPPLRRHHSPPYPPRQVTPNQAPQHHLSSSRRRKQTSRRPVLSAEQCRKPRRRPKLLQRCALSSISGLVSKLAPMCMGAASTASPGC